MSDLDDVLLIGTYMSNALFNLARSMENGPRRDLLLALCSDWDAALRKYHTESERRKEQIQCPTT